MQVGDWWMFLSFYQNVLAVPLAIIVFVLIIRTKSARNRVLYGALIVVLFLPHIQRFVGDYYFDYLCRTQAGEFIYRTVDNVEGILQMRPRDGSKDYFDRMRAGDIPEDPWGHTNREAQRPWFMINRYSYIEVPVHGSTTPSNVLSKTYHRSMFDIAPENAKVARFSGYDGSQLSSFRKQFDVAARSKYGYTWAETTNWIAKLLNIRKGEIKVVDIHSPSSPLGIAVGFYRTRPIDICPSGKDDRLVERFVTKVVRPPNGHRALQ